jgi:hypothetical protein
VALLPNEEPVDPQPSSLPTVSFTGQIAAPWDAEAQGLPVPPSDRIFQGQFNIEYPYSAFPPEAEDPAEQLTYRATVEFNNWSGGFTDVSFQNTLTVDFEPTEPPEPAQSVFYWSGTNLLSTGSETITVTIQSDEPAQLTSSTLLSQPAVKLTPGYVTYWRISEGLASSVADLPYTLEWFGDIPINATGSAYVTILASTGSSGAGGIGIVGQPNSVADVYSIGGQELASACSGCDINTEITWNNPVHIAQQRIGNQLYLHINGALIASVGDSGNFLDSSASFSIEAALFTGNSVIYKLGQGRLTVNEAIYGTGNFTPPSTAFYVP